MGDYMNHWLEMGDKLGDKAPRIFYVSWFRKDADGKWLWPGFGDNSRVLKWMCERVEGKIDAVDTPIGKMPKEGDLDLKGLDIPEADFKELMRVDVEAWKDQANQIEAHYAKFGSRLPARLKKQLEELRARLSK